MKEGEWGGGVGGAAAVALHPINVITASIRQTFNLWGRGGGRLWGREWQRTNKGKKRYVCICPPPVNVTQAVESSTCGADPRELLITSGHLSSTGEHIGGAARPSLSSLSSLLAQREHRPGPGAVVIFGGVWGGGGRIEVKIDKTH